MGKSDKTKSGSGPKVSVSSTQHSQISAQAQNTTNARAGNNGNSGATVPNNGCMNGQPGLSHGNVQGNVQGQQFYQSYNQGHQTQIQSQPGNYQFDISNSSNQGYGQQNFDIGYVNHVMNPQNVQNMSNRAQQPIGQIANVSPAMPSMPNYTQLSGNQHSPGMQSYNGTNGMSSSQGESSNSLQQIVQQMQQMNSTFLSRLDLIDQKVSKLDLIERDVSFTRTDVCKLKQENTELKQKVDDMEKTCITISSMFDDLKAKSSEAETDVYDLRNMNSKLQDEMSKLENKHSKMSEDLLEIKCRAMQENLLFFGIAEAPKGENDNSEMKLRDFLETELGEPDKIQTIKFDRVHRLGRPQFDSSIGRIKCRPIVAKFENYTDREYVRKAGIELNKRRCGYSIREHFPPEIEERRKLLYPVMRHYAKDDTNRVKLIRDKLYINGELYTTDQDVRTRDTVKNQKESINNRYHGQQSDRRYARPKQNRSRPAPQSDSANSGPLLNTVNRFQSLQEYSGTPEVLTGKQKARSPLMDETELKKRFCNEAPNLDLDIVNSDDAQSVTHETEPSSIPNEEMDFEDIAAVTDLRSNEQLSDAEGEKSNKNEQILPTNNQTDPVPEQAPANTQNTTVG